MDNTSILIFRAITGFISDLNQEFGANHKSIALYNRLLEKTGIVNIGPINKHIDSFRKFFNANKAAMEEKNPSKFTENRISYSDRVFVDVQQILSQCDKENSKVIWKHLLTIWGLIDPTSQAKKVLQEYAKNSENKEAEFLTNIIDKVEKTVGSGDIDASNPMAAVSSLMSSGVFNDLIMGMQSGLSNGSLDIGKLMGTVQGMIGKMSPDGGMPNELSGMMNMMGPLLGGLGGNMGNMPSMSSSSSSSSSSAASSASVEEEKD